MIKRILFGASYSVIEPLGLLHLSGLARDLGWERKFHLVKDHNFESFFEQVNDFKPDVVGFNVYTGNHLQLRDAFKRLKKDKPNIITVVGGPHPTYFPSESQEFADYVVMSEGFGALRRILKGEVRPGILHLQETERFPHPDRKVFYDDYPEHKKSGIKSIITMTGCPYKCTYCYNSSTPNDIAGNMPADIADKLAKSLGLRGRLFPHNVRSVEDVINEGKEISQTWPVKVIYFQDDVHAFDLQKWVPDFAKTWPNEVGIPYHAQMRWEMTAQPKRLDLLCEAGCFGLTLAIEATDPEIRTEVLDRRMPTDLMYRGMKDIIDRGLRVRTEQITALPYGATTNPTAINLEADLQLIELNVDLRKKTGGPTMAWASTFAPYKGTKLGEYCKRYGHYNGNNSDVPDTFFERSVMRFPNQWVGAQLEKLKDNSDFWLNESELERYRNQNAELRRNFNFFTLVPEGHKLAKSYLENPQLFSYERIGRETEAHLRALAHDDGDVDGILNKIKMMRESINATHLQNDAILRDANCLVPYFACLPKGELAMKRAIEYSIKKINGNEDGIKPITLSTAVRHHLYDNVLYETDSRSSEHVHMLESQRFASKV